MSTGTLVEVIEILITGTPKTGKSTFVEKICDHTGVEEGMEDWLFGYLQVDDSMGIHFLEPPAASMFDFIWLRELIEQSEVPGYIVMCDSTQPETFGETLGLLQTVRMYHPDASLALVCNKQDVPGSWSAEDIRISLRIPDDILVVPCNAQSFKSVKNAVVKLLRDIFG